MYKSQDELLLLEYSIRVSSLPIDLLSSSFFTDDIMDSGSSGISTELYTNLNNIGKYVYPREFLASVTFESKQLTTDGTNYTTVTITGIPDGVSPRANEAMIIKGAPRRLYVFSDQPLDASYLKTLDGFYGRTPYPILTIGEPCGRLDSVPKNNFYLCYERPNVLTEFIEYRYVQNRHAITKIAYDASTGNVYSLILPNKTSYKPLLVIVMPENFVRTGLKQGYFRFDNNLIVRIYSKYLLSSKLEDGNYNGYVSVITTDNGRLRGVIETFFSRLGLHVILSNETNQIYAYDNFMTSVVGSVANIVVP